jgi:molybdate transport system regulatory protein
MIIYNGLASSLIIFPPGGNMKEAHKVWLDNKGKAFGEGPFQLLQEVENTGSLHQAAKHLKMSYTKAWLVLSRCEKNLGFPLLERKIGGIAGGGSQVTPRGREMMAKYQNFRREVDQSLQRIYKKHFG